MSSDPIQRIASWILRMNQAELERLRLLLNEGDGGSGDPAGVGAIIPPNLPLKADGAEADLLFPDGLPEDYWETAT